MTVQHLKNHNCNELWREVRNGSRKAFEELYNNTVIHLSEYALRLLKDEHAVKDIIQDLFVNIYIRRQEIGEDINITGYLHNAVKYKTMRLLRERASNNILPLLPGGDDLTHSHHDKIEQGEIHAELENNINTLPVKCRKAFMLNYVDELPYKEIAAEMNISIKTVEKHISKALKILRNGRWKTMEPE